MPERPSYSPRERAGLWLLASLGLAGINGAFLVGLATPGALSAALSNPVSLAFIVEAFVLVGLLAYLIDKWGVATLEWPWLVALSLLGGLAFAVPVVILWRRPGREGVDELNGVI
jgi:hypothetical protein